MALSLHRSGQCKQRLSRPSLPGQRHELDVVIQQSMESK